MENHGKINFYETRTMGERVTAATEFVKQTWKIIWKHVMIVALPFIILSVYVSSFIDTSALMAQAMQGDLDVWGPEYSNMIKVSLLTMLVQGVMSCMIYGMVGTMMNLYEAGRLNDSLGTWTIVQKSFPLMLKTFLIGIISGILLVVAAMLLGLLTFTIPILGAFLMFIFIIAIIPFFFIVLFPAYFQGKGVFGSVIEAIKVSFKNWPPLMGVILILVMVAMVASMVFTVPSSTLMLSPSVPRAVILLFSLLQMIISTLIIPIYIIYPAFQYFSFVEQKEGLSIQSDIDEFDKL